MAELTINDFQVKAKICYISRRINGNEPPKFKLLKAKVSSITINSKGIKIKETPKIFNSSLDIDEYDDFRKISESGLIIVNTPLLVTDETEKYLESVVEHWNKYGVKSIWEG
jgi:hypothetical protein